MLQSRSGVRVAIPRAPPAINSTCWRPELAPAENMLSSSENSRDDHCSIQSESQYGQSQCCHIVHSLENYVSTPITFGDFWRNNVGDSVTSRRIRSHASRDQSCIGPGRPTLGRGLAEHVCAHEIARGPANVAQQHCVTVVNQCSRRGHRTTQEVHTVRVLLLVGYLLAHVGLA